MTSGRSSSASARTSRRRPSVSADPASGSLVVERPPWSPWDETYANTPDRFIWGTRASNLARALTARLGERARVLDLGCGEGRDSVFLAEQGRDAEAVRHAEEAVSIDPLSGVMHQTLGLVHYYGRRYDRAIVAELGRVDVHVDDLQIGREAGRAPELDHPVEARADGQHHVRLAIDVERWTRGVATARIDAEPQGQRVVFGEDTFADQRGGDGHRQQLGQLLHFRRGIRRQSATANIENGKGSLYQEVCGSLNILGIRRRFPPRPDRVILQGCVRPLCTQHISWHLQDHRARGTRTKRGEGAAHHSRNVVHSGKRALPLHQPIKNTGGHFLLVLFPKVA